jgi:hypothetical protein
MAAGGGADRRSAKNAGRSINQSREAHHPARPLHSPEGAMRRMWLDPGARVPLQSETGDRETRWRRGGHR